MEGKGNRVAGEACISGPCEKVRWRRVSRSNGRGGRRGGKGWQPQGAHLGHSSCPSFHSSFPCLLRPPLSLTPSSSSFPLSLSSSFSFFFSRDQSIYLYLYLSISIFLSFYLFLCVCLAVGIFTELCYNSPSQKSKVLAGFKNREWSGR